MSDELIIGIDAGTSVMKSVVFTTDGRQLAVAGRANQYRTLPGGGVEQNLTQTWDDAAWTLRELHNEIPDLAERIVAVSVTGQGDGTWLMDADGDPVGEALLWLDSRAADVSRAVIGAPDYRALYERTGTGVNPCQQSSQLVWLMRNEPERIAAAATAFHCKDWLYFRLTGVRATDPSEGVFTFGDYRQRNYAPQALQPFGLQGVQRLLPPIVDGANEATDLSDEAAAQTGLPAGTPVVLGYVDVACTALGGGLYDRTGDAGCSVIGSTGMHMRLARDADAVRLNDDGTGYTMCFPAPGTLAQMQSNMAATLNIDWIVDLLRGALAAEGVERSRADLLERTDERVLAAAPGATVFHPYISTAGERGPFMEPAARASFTGLDTSVDFDGLMRGVFEGLAFAARDCYEAMGGIPGEIRVAGGGARSGALRAILAAALERPVRRIDREEAGAAGAAMIAAVQQRIYPDMDACAAGWVTSRLREAEHPDPDLAAVYARGYAIYKRTREVLRPLWRELGAAREGIAP